MNSGYFLIYFVMQSYWIQSLFKSPNDVSYPNCRLSMEYQPRNQSEDKQNPKKQW